MRKWLTLLMTLLVGCTSYANANTGLVTFEAGYRRDDINWKHQFPSCDPLVSSSTNFKDLDIFQIGVQARSTIGYNFYARGNAYWGWILDGKYERKVSSYFTGAGPVGSDYGSSADSFRFAFNDKQTSIIDDQYVYGVAGAIGYPFYFCDCTTVLAPVIGYAYDHQNVRIDSDGFNFCQSSGNVFPTSGYGNDGCCRQTFISRWYGPFVGLDFLYNPWETCWNLYADLEFHWGSFKGRRNHGDGSNFWDRGDRSSHNAKGWLFALGGEYELCNEWTMGLAIKFQDWNANRHRHQRECGDSYDDDSVSGDNRAYTKNKWRSTTISVAFGKAF